MANILVLHGPNLNLLGSRQPTHYGTTSLAAINENLTALAAADKHAIVCMQSNAEADLIARVQQAADDDTDFIIINPAAFTHTSIALRDAFAAVEIPFIEVHLSNVYARESFRHHSYFSGLAVGVIAGFGARGYEFAYHAAVQHLAAQGDA